MKLKIWKMICLNKTKNKLYEGNLGRVIFMNNKLNFWNIVNWLFGIVVFIDGLLNLFRGNDFGFGVFLILLSLIYFPPTNIFLNNFLKKKFNFSIHYMVKIILGIFIIWVTLAVGALAEGYYPEIW